MRILCALLFVLPSGTFAQSWCAPGAEWTYTFSNGWNIEGRVRYTYGTDTLIDGIATQRIAQQITGTYFGEPYDQAGPDLHTRTNGGLVTILNESSFDTLYNFDAVPGDTWQVAPGMMPGPVIEVVDTGTMVIGAVPLHYLVVLRHDGMLMDTIVERIGALQGFMEPWVAFLLDHPAGPLRCYSDQDISYQASWWPYACTSLLAIDGVPSARVPLHPNPGTTHFTLDLPPGMHTIELYDATGRCVSQQQTALDRAVIDTQALPPGMYHVRVLNSNGTGTHHKWIKE